MFGEFRKRRLVDELGAVSTEYLVIAGIMAVLIMTVFGTMSGQMTEGSGSLAEKIGGAIGGGLGGILGI